MTVPICRSGGAAASSLDSLGLLEGLRVRALYAMPPHGAGEYYSIGGMPRNGVAVLLTSARQHGALGPGTGPTPRMTFEGRTTFGCGMTHSRWEGAMADHERVRRVTTASPLSLQLARNHGEGD